MQDIFKIVESFEDSGLSLEGVSETIKNEAKEQKQKQKEDFLVCN